MLLYAIDALDCFERCYVHPGWHLGGQSKHPSGRKSGWPETRLPTQDFTYDIFNPGLDRTVTSLRALVVQTLAYPH